MFKQATAKLSLLLLFAVIVPASRIHAQSTTSTTQTSVITGGDPEPTGEPTPSVITGGDPEPTGEPTPSFSSTLLHAATAATRLALRLS